jgi:AcrR family transcriptional regulator
MNKKLTADDWIEAGMRALASQGFQALKAEPLAKALGVSRGSFYWHFADVEVYQQAVIQRWRKRATETVIADVENMETGAGRLRSLLLRALSAEATFEIRMRAWAVNDDVAAAAVAHVDQERRAYLIRLLASAGIEPELAETRATILYWAYLGCSLADRKPTGRVLDLVVEELHALGLGGH